MTALRNSNLEKLLQDAHELTDGEIIQRINKGIKPHIMQCQLMH